MSSEKIKSIESNVRSILFLIKTLEAVFVLVMPYEL
jgi:hypothetical protein